MTSSHWLETNDELVLPMPEPKITRLVTKKARDDWRDAALAFWPECGNRKCGGYATYTTNGQGYPFGNAFACDNCHKFLSGATAELPYAHLIRTRLPHA